MDLVHDKRLTTGREIKFAKIDASSSGNNEIVAAVSGKQIRVINCMMIASGAVNAKFQSSAGGTDVTGTLPLTANSGFTQPESRVGWFETVAGESLNLNLSGAVQVGGCLAYILLP